jgi:hypothetical protein
MRTFTVFLQDYNHTGTTYITAVRAKNLTSATSKAKQLCRDDWGLPGSPEPHSNATTNDLHVLGVAEGDVKILEWNDLG